MRAKVVKIVWGLKILYCTIKTRMIYFCVATLFKDRNWRIFIIITKKIRQKMILVYSRKISEETMSLVLHRGIKLNSILHVTYLHRSTNSEQLLSMIRDRSSVPRSSRLLIKNISQKCSRDDRKRTLGGLHGHGVVQTIGVGAPMVPRGQVIHHQQTCRAQQRVVPTISRWS